MHWALYPLLSGLLALALALCLFLFLSLKAEIHGVWRRTVELRAAVEALHASQAAMEAVLKEIEEQTGTLVPPPPSSSGLNIGKRSQVLRRHRLGEDPDQIAAALNLPRTEVDLLLKVNRIVLEQL